MDTTHAPTRKPRKPRNPSGGQRGNQNARKHGRYSMLKPAERYAPLKKVLRSYGLKDPFIPGNLSVEDLLDDPNVNVRLLYVLLQTSIELFLLKDRVSRL